jgi:hypothetical protein
MVADFWEIGQNAGYLSAVRAIVGQARAVGKVLFKKE